MTIIPTRQENEIREPSIVDALIPLGFMIVMLTWSIVLFGIDAASGPLQVALIMSAVVAGVVAHKNGHSWERLGEEIVKGISLAMSAILILLMVGALIGVWNMSGTIATVVYYGIEYINPTWFYLAAAVLTGLIGIVTGSSWTTAARLGVSTFVYFPYCFFNFINPILGLIFGFAGINVQRLTPEDYPAAETLPRAALVDQRK